MNSWLFLLTIWTSIFLYHYHSDAPYVEKELQLSDLPPDIRENFQNVFHRKVLKNGKMELPSNKCKKEMVDRYLQERNITFDFQQVNPHLEMNEKYHNEYSHEEKKQLYKFSNGSLPRIGWILIIHNEGNLKSLFKHIYSDEDIYIIHVDTKAQHLVSRVKEITSGFKHIVVFSKNNVQWCGKSLLQAYLDSFRELLKFEGWDYLITMSGNDYPLQSVTNYKRELSFRANYFNTSAISYMELGQIPSNYLYSRFFECEGYIYQYYWNTQFFNLSLYSGSAWYTLHHDFVTYIVSDAEFIKKFNLATQSTIVLDEIYPPTVMMNSPFTKNLILDNGRYINWEKQRHECPYKRVGDLCGNHPGWLKYRDIIKLIMQEQFFFARKIRNSQVIELIDDFIKKKKQNIPLNLGPFHVMTYDNYCMTEMGEGVQSIPCSHLRDDEEYLESQKWNMICTHSEKFLFRNGSVSILSDYRAKKQYNTEYCIIQSVTNKKCLDVTNYDINAKTTLSLYDCHYKENQLWTFPVVESLNETYQPSLQVYASRYVPLCVKFFTKRNLLTWKCENLIQGLKFVKIQ